MGVGRQKLPDPRRKGDRGKSQRPGRTWAGKGTSKQELGSCRSVERGRKGGGGKSSVKKGNEGRRERRREKAEGEHKATKVHLPTKTGPIAGPIQEKSQSRGRTFIITKKSGLRKMGE